MEPVADEQKKELKLFFRRGLVFAAPYLIFFIFTTYLFFSSAELASIKNVVRRQQLGKREILLGLAYSNPIFYYKLHSVLKRKPEALVLGSSRTMQFRAQFFSDPAIFFNSGGGVDKIKHFKIFLNKIPLGQEPKLLIIGLDQNFFSEQWNASSPDYDVEDKYRAPESRAHIMITQWTKLYKDFFNHKFSFSTLTQRDPLVDKVGFNALAQGNGFRSDGSRYEFSIIHTDPAEHLQSIFDASAEFPPGSVDSRSLNELDLFLEEASRRGIHVIGFLPPYAPKLHGLMALFKEQLGYIFKLKSAVDPIFKKHHFMVYDFTDALVFGSSNTEFIDIHHGSEKTYLRLFIKMAGADEFLRQYVNIDQLKETLRTATNDLEVFGD